MGCGTGSLILTLPAFANIASAAGIDLTEPYVAAARARNSDPRFTLTRRRRALPYPNSSFDGAYSLLVLQFIPEARKAVEEMRRVVRPGGTITAAVWDHYGGQSLRESSGTSRASSIPRWSAHFPAPLTDPERWRSYG